MGISAEDLQDAKAFFLDFGLEVQEEGGWLDQIVRLTDVKTAYALMGMLGGQANLELIKYYRPSDENGIQPPLANTLGIRHIAFVVEDIEAVVAKLKAKSQAIFREIQNQNRRITQ